MKSVKEKNPVYEDTAGVNLVEGSALPVKKASYFVLLRFSVLEVQYVQNCVTQIP